MQLPALMYKSLRFCEKAEDDETLFKLLSANPPQLIKFIERGVEDETWVSGHTDFMETTLAWLTERFYEDKLLMVFAQRVAAALRKHHGAVESFIPLNLTIRLKDKDLRINGLMYGSSSEYLREMLRRECRDKRSRELLLKEVPHSAFSTIDDFINTGTALDLYRHDKKELFKILNLAMLWDLKDLTTACQNELKKFLTRENMFEMLLRAHAKHREVLRTASFEFINKFKLGCKFENRGLEYLAFEFLEFTENALAAFELVRLEVTHLICGDGLTEEDPFPKVVNACPKLICLDISRSNAFSDHLKEVPQKLQELELSACLWMDNEGLSKIVELFPDLLRLVLTSDVRIDYEGWGVLKGLTKLRILDLTRCFQAGDEELKMILQALPDLIGLNLEECRSMTDAGFSEIPNFNAKLTHLSLARNDISDIPLIEIGSKCIELTNLDLTHCDSLTDKGFFELIRNANNLKELNLTQCKIAKATLTQIRKLRPYVHIII